MGQSWCVTYRKHLWHKTYYCPVSGQGNINSCDALPLMAAAWLLERVAVVLAPALGFSSGGSVDFGCNHCCGCSRCWTWWLTCSSSGFIGIIATTQTCDFLCLSRKISQNGNLVRRINCGIVYQHKCDLYFMYRDFPIPLSFSLQTF